MKKKTTKKPAAPPKAAAKKRPMSPKMLAHLRKMHAANRKKAKASKPAKAKKAPKSLPDPVPEPAAPVQEQPQVQAPVATPDVQDTTPPANVTSGEELL